MSVKGLMASVGFVSMVMVTNASAEDNWYYYMYPKFHKSIDNGAITIEVVKMCAPDEWDAEAEKEFVGTPYHIRCENNSEIYPEFIGTGVCDVIVLSDEMYSAQKDNSNLSFFNDSLTIRARKYLFTS